MLLAVFTVFLLLDRSIGYATADFIPVIGTVCLITYYQNCQNGLPLILGILILSFIFGNPTTKVYSVIGILVGVFYCYFLYGKHISNRKLFLLLMLFYLLAELIVCLLINPLLFGLSLEKQLNFSREVFNRIGIHRGSSLLSMVILLLTLGFIALVDTMLLFNLMEVSCKIFNGKDEVGKK